MPNYIFSESSGLNDSIYGKCQAPIKMFIEQRGEEFEKKSLLKDLFLMQDVDNYGNTITGMTSMRGFLPVGENGAYPSDSMEEGYQKQLNAVTWKDSFAISQELIEDAKLMDLKRAPAGFMTSYGRTREKFGAAIYAGAMNGAKTITFGGKVFDICGADEKPIFSTGHVGKVDKKSQANLFSDEFSAEALDAVETEMHHFKDDTGEILDLEPDTIVIGDNAVLKRRVFEVIGADKDPVTSNNAFNYQYGRWNVIIWPYLDQFLAEGATPWMLMDSKFNQTYGGAVWHDRLKLAVKSTIDDNTDANVWRGRSRFNATFNDWRFAALGGVVGGKNLV